MGESKGLWFLVGLSLGSLAGILYAPQSGEDTRAGLRNRVERGREQVRSKASDWREQAREQTEDLRSRATNLRDQAEDIADRGRQVVTRQIDQFQAAVEAGKQAYRDAAGLNKSETGS